MNLLKDLQERFRAAVAAVTGNRLSAGELDELAAIVRPSQDPKFGDYQANLAMPLAKKLGRPPRDIAADMLAQIDLSEICEPPEIAGPGFINVQLRTDWLARRLNAAVADERLGIERVGKPRTIVVDYSAPNVAKPMHVGHIRSTVIGDSLYRTLKFLGHTVIGDNHIGDWGTQFGMIIYGYKHFLDRAAYESDPVHELSRLYRLVNRLVGYFEGRERLPELEQKVAAAEAQLKTEPGRAPAEKPDKKSEKGQRQSQRAVEEAKAELQNLRESLAAVKNDPQLAAAAKAHPEIGMAVLKETAKLHVGDSENIALWREFLPPCLVDIDHIYRRLGVTFDHTLGESFYHDRLGGVVEDLLNKGIARWSEGAVAVFFDDKPGAPPFLIQKQDGAFLYGTSDLATIQYRMETWRPYAILYVVDHRQSLHFEQLFATAHCWGYSDVELQHIKFGTVLGEDGRPFKTRAGDTVGLEGLLDEAIERALNTVSENDDAKPSGPELSPADRQRVAEAVGIGALKYADLSQNRTSDYVFSYDKMLAMNGNTATYMQYAHARVRSIFAKGQRDAGIGVSDTAAASGATIKLEAPAERALGLELLRFSEALDAVASDYRPNHLTNYLFELANRYSTFYEQCPVLKAETPERRASRLALCDLTARTLKQGLALLGIDVVEKM
jgi:arginyl-tRNA synthetase